MSQTTSRRDLHCGPNAGRHFLLLLPALVSLGLATACDGAFSAERRIERAGERFGNGQYAEAMEDLKTALEAEPENVEGRVLLARVSLKLGDTATARKELDRAISAGADPRAVRDLHYAIFLEGGRFEDALIAAAVDEDLEGLQRQMIMVTAQEGLGKYDEAQASLDQAFAIDPDYPEARLFQAILYWDTGRIPDADDALDELLAQRPDYALAWLYRARFALAVGDAKRAGDAFEQARQHASLQLDFPDQVSLLVGLVESWLALGDVAGADTELTALQQRAPNAFVTRYLKARLAYAKGQNSVAVAELQRALSQRPDNGPARLLLGAALLADGSIEQAEAELNRLLADEPENLEARKLLARLYLSRDDTTAARRVLAEAPASITADSGSDWLAGAAALLAGKTVEARALLEQGVQADPGNVAMRLDLAQVYLASGQRDDALRVLASIPEGSGGLRQRQLRVLAEIAGRSLVEAKPRIERLADESPNDAELLTVAAYYLGAAGDQSGARNLYERAQKADANSVEPRLGLAAIAMRAGDLGAANGHLQSVLDVDAEDERAYIGLSAAALTRGNREQAQDWLERAIGANPAVVESRLRLAQMSMEDGDPIRAKALIDQALAVTKTRAATLHRVGEIYLAGSQFDEALSRFNDAAALGLTQADVSAGAALIALGRTDAARARLEAAASARPTWAMPLIYLSALDSGERRFDQALARVDKFAKAGGSPAAADEIRGDILSAAGRPSDALGAYERAAAARPSSSVTIKIFRARGAAGRPQPEAGLKRWLETSPEDVGIRTILAEYYQLSGDRGSAVKQYERILESTVSPPVQNNLAWLYYELGDERAEDLARRAHEAAPDNAEIADTYGWILVEKGKVEAGLPVLETAVKKTTHPEVRYHHASALAQVGQKKAAGEALRRLLADVEAFPSRAAAQELLDSLSRSELGL